MTTNIFLVIATFGLSLIFQYYLTIAILPSKIRVLSLFLSTGCTLPGINIEDVVKRSNLKELTNDDGYITLKVPAKTAFDSIVHHAVYGNYIPLQTDL